MRGIVWFLWVFWLGVVSKIIIFVESCVGWLVDKMIIGNGLGIVVGIGKDIEFGVIFLMM